MPEAPHITIGHHPHHGVVAALTADHHVTNHLLRRVGFEPVPDSRLYALSEPGRDPLRRTQLAVQSLRAARRNVTADAAYDLQPGQPLPPETPAHTVAAVRRRAQAALATSPAQQRPGVVMRPSAETAWRPAPTAAPRPARTR